MLSSSVNRASQKKFLVDVMLQKLGRWLRILGVPAEMPESEDDNDILEQAREHDLILITRDAQLAERAEKRNIKVFAMPKRETEVENQLKLVVDEFGIKLEGFKDRTLCTKCGAELELVGKDRVEGKIPDKVLERLDDFLVCKSCGQVYWEGRQWKKINERISKISKEKK